MTSPVPELPGFSEVERLGHGGLGDVYRARRDSTGVLVAIKVLRDWSDGSTAWHRTRRELAALVQLRGHPNVVHVDEVLQVGGVPHIVMEYAAGGSVHERAIAAGGRLGYREVVRIGEHAASALAAAHSLGIVHLDVKPRNLLFGSFDTVKLCDFGIAALTLTEEFRERTAALSARYASPEQLSEREVGPASDVYMLGATIGHLLTGIPPTQRREGSVDTWLAAWPEPESATGDVRGGLYDLVLVMTEAEQAARPTAGWARDEFKRLGLLLQAPVDVQWSPEMTVVRGGRRVDDGATVPRIGAAYPSTSPPDGVPGPIRQPVPSPEPVDTASPEPAPPPARSRPRWAVAGAVVLAVVLVAGAAIAIGRRGSGTTDEAAVASTLVGSGAAATASMPVADTTAPAETAPGPALAAPPSTTLGIGFDVQATELGVVARNWSVDGQTLIADVAVENTGDAPVLQQWYYEVLPPAIAQSRDQVAPGPYEIVNENPVVLGWFLDIAAHTSAPMRYEVSLPAAPTADDLAAWKDDQIAATADFTALRTAPPVVTLDGTDDEVVAESGYVVAGSSTGAVTVTVNGAAVELGPDGRWFAEVLLVPGDNVISVVATSRFDVAVEAARTVRYQPPQPTPRPRSTGGSGGGSGSGGSPSQPQPDPDPDPAPPPEPPPAPPAEPVLPPPPP